MKTKSLLSALPLFALFMFLMTSCSNGPEPISFGEDGCAFCKMTIVDTKFGAEIVSTKGKVYKFDALECMLGFENKGYIESKDIKAHYVIDASQPAILVEADKVQYLQSENLPSPMGGNVSAFQDVNVLEQMHSEFSGKMLDWSGVKEAFKN